MHVAGRNVLIGVLRVETELVVALAVAGLETGLESFDHLVEAVRGKRLEVVLLVNVVDGDLVVHLQTVQEK